MSSTTASAEAAVNAPAIEATGAAAASPPRRSPRRPRRRAPWWLRRAWRAWAALARAGEGLGALLGLRRRPRGEWLVLEADAAEELQHELAERRCGWFDSSQDLREGLQISEHGNDDAVAAELPVMAWVQMQLCGWQPKLEGTAP